MLRYVAASWAVNQVCVGFIRSPANTRCAGRSCFGFVRGVSSLYAVTGFRLFITLEVYRIM